MTRTRLHVDTLSDLLDVKVEGPSLANFNPDHAISLWWNDCKTGRRVLERSTEQGRPSRLTQIEPQEGTLTLEDWDEWFDSHVDDLNTDILESD